MTNRLTATIGVRYDLEKIPVAEMNNPKFANEDDYPVDTRQHPAAGRAVLRDRRHRAVRRARRIRALLRQDALRDHRRPLQQRRVLGLVHRELPDLGGGSRTAQRTVPDRSDARERSGAEPRAAGSAVPARSDARGTRERHARRSGPPGCRDSDQLSVGYEHQFGATISFSADYVHVFWAARCSCASTRTRACATTTASTSADRQAGPDVPAGQHVPQRRRDRLRRAPAAGREAALARLQRARVLHASRTRPATPVRTARRRSTSRSGTDDEPRPERGPDRLRSAGTIS